LETFSRNLHRTKKVDNDPELGVTPLAETKTEIGARVVVAQGSVIDFQGDAMVNAANTGCLGGGGVDGAISRAGGSVLAEARRKLPMKRPNVRCETGGAVITVGGSLNTKYCIHAVGPAYYDSGMDGITDDDLDALLYMSYSESLKCAQEMKLKTVGFSLLSAGIFRAHRSLSDVLAIGLKSIIDNVYEGLEAVYMVGFTRQEASTLETIMKQYEKKEFPEFTHVTDSESLKRTQIKVAKKDARKNDLIVGQNVTLQFKEDRVKHLNGKVAEVIGWKQENGRWRVRVTVDGAVKLYAILRENLILVEEESPDEEEVLDQEEDKAATGEEKNEEVPDKTSAASEMDVEQKSPDETKKSMKVEETKAEENAEEKAKDVQGQASKVQVVENQTST